MSLISVYRAWLITCALVVPLPAAEVVIQRAGADSTLRVDGGPVFHTTAANLTDARAISFAGSPTIAVVWNEQDAQGTSSAYYAISFDGFAFPIIRQTSYEIGIAPMQGGWPRSSDLGPSFTRWLLSYAPFLPFDGPTSIPIHCQH